MKHSILSDCMSSLNNAEHIGKKSCIVTASGLVLSVLKTIQKEGYIGDFELREGRGQDKFKVNLIGNINKCNTIRPRFSVKKGDYEKWEKRYLPAKGLGILIMSTSEGIMTHDEAKEKDIGGKLVAYVY